MTTELFSLLKPGDKQQLICFPYLGGYANSFLGLMPHLHHSIEVWGVTFPGHGGNTSPPLQDLAALVALLFEDIKKIMRPNCVFIGHSMGAIVAYFLLQKLLFSESSVIKPAALIVSASLAPSYFSEAKISKLTDHALLAHLHMYGGISEEMIKEKSLIEYFLPTYRADFKILESAAVYPYQPIECPVYYFWGEDDPIVSLNDAWAWRSYFQNDIQFVPLVGAAHMFIESKASEMAKHIEDFFAECETHAVYSESTQDNLC